MTAITIGVCVGLLAIPANALLGSSRIINRMASVEALYSNNVDLDSPPSTKIKVLYENRWYMIDATDGESILAALEKARASPNHSLPPIPNECRKGNCLTCAARVIPSSSKKKLGQIYHVEDGLNPQLSQEIHKNGYILTCSSFVSSTENNNKGNEEDGQALALEIGCHDKAWAYTFSDRHSSIDAENIRMASRARAIRKASEQNVRKWKQQTEQNMNLNLDGTLDEP